MIELSENSDSGSLDLFVLSPRIKTEAEALDKAGVDLNRWEAYQVHVKSWEVGAKIETTDIDTKRKVTRGMAVCPLFGISVKLRLRTGWNVSDFREILLKEMREHRPKYPKLKHTRRAGTRHLAELSISDHHFGKLAWEPETGNNYDLKIAEETYMHAAEDLIRRALVFTPERWLFIVGNDLLHTDLGGLGQTTAGTRQDTDGRWQKTYLVARKCCVRVTEMLLASAPVDILIIPGNHDEEKMFCLGDSLTCQFHDHPAVTVNNGPNKKKFYRYGTNLLGFQHGHKQKDKKHLPLDMASEVPELWAQTTWREIHCGHFHSEKEEVWYMKRSESIGEVIVRYLPSLCGRDLWHADAGYRSMPAAECHLYDHDTGRAGYVSVSPRRSAE